MRTAGELAEDLRRFCADRPILARRPTLAGRIRRWSRRHRRATAAAGVILLVASLASAAGMAKLWQERQQLWRALERRNSHKTESGEAARFHVRRLGPDRGQAAVRLAASSKNSPEAEDDREFCRAALAYYEKIAWRLWR